MTDSKMVSQATAKECRETALAVRHVLYLEYLEFVDQLDPMEFAKKGELSHHYSLSKYAVLYTSSLKVGIKKLGPGFKGVIINVPNDGLYLKVSWV